MKPNSIVRITDVQICYRHDEETKPLSLCRRRQNEFLGVVTIDDAIRADREN